MPEAFEPYAPPQSNLIRPSARPALPQTPEGLPRFGPLLKETLGIWRAEAGTFALVVLAVRLPLNVISALFGGIGYGEDLESSCAVFGWHLVQKQHLILEILLGVLSYLGLAWLVERVRQDGSRSFHECLAATVPRWPAGVWTQFLGTLAWIAGLVLLVVPGIFIGVATSFSPMLVSLRGRSGLEALHGSWDLVRGRWWPVFWLLVMLSVIEAGFGLLMALPSRWLPEHLLVTIAEGLLMDFIGAFFFVAMVIVFLELDAQRRAASEAPAPPPPDEPEYVGTGRSAPPVLGLVRTDEWGHTSVPASTRPATWSPRCSR